MGFGTGPKIPLWAVILVICCIQQKASSVEDVPERVTIIPPLKKIAVISSFHSAHNGQICSTWGSFHFKTFDGDIYNFPGACNYIFAFHCAETFEDFNIQIRRQIVGNTSTISYIAVILAGTNFKMEKDNILVNDKRIQLPYNGPGFEIENFFNYIKMESKIGLTLMWNKEDSLMLELDKKYANSTCGLCGDFNGISKYKEFYFENTPITDFQFGNQWKVNDPTEDCEDPIPPPQKNCTDEYDICRKILTGSAFIECNDIVNVNSYIDACVHDMCLCNEVEKSSCLCETFTEYSRQCAHAGGQPQNWRSLELCPISCPSGMHYQECGSPCANTCTNSERSHVCEDHCIDGCFCPPGTVLDDINGNACIPFEQCSCIYNGESYAPGMTYSAPCRSCVCSGGEWNCTELPCRSICSIEGGSHISTYDEVWYNFHGKCNYILTKICEEETFTVLGDLGPCGFAESETCLKMVALTINRGETYAAINHRGKIIVNGMSAQLPISVANVTIFQPSHSFIVLETNFGLQIVVQLKPLLQLYIYLDPSFQGRMCGLCGNFNHNQRDDFKTLNGLIEGTAIAFANTWKTEAACDNIKQHFNDPCTVSTENEKYARHWCGLLTDGEGPFAKCHPIVNPKAYHTNCMYDSCACKISEKCMCAALSSYVRACRAKGIELVGWRTNACFKYTTCPKSLNYSYEISSCQPTCRSLSEPDITCNIKFVPVDGCTCEHGTYMDDSETCVPANKCPCYYKGTTILPGEVFYEFGDVCTCNQGKLNCYGDGDSKQECTAPMVYFDCRNATTDSKGAGCQKSCQTLDSYCYTSKCVSGCICPDGLVSDGKGGCIPVEECPCIHNEATYQPGENIKVDCNTCVCKNRMWKCTMKKCLSTCAVYGDGHYITFDDKRYIFSGQCEYTLLQNYCGQNSSTQGLFRIISENIPCGTTGTTCSKSIKVFFKNYELILTEEQYKVVKRESGGQIPYRIHQMGIYLMIEIQKELIVLWDKKTSVFIKLGAEFKGEVCGLCGNNDGNAVNDFTTRSRSVVGDVLEFGNSWKVSPTCPDAKCVKDPCSKNPYRKAWSQKKCSIINSEVFAACHSQVEPTKYYEACVTDACACDTGGDCECFCTAAAAYAKVCSDHGICVSWRTPSICPMFCDYYNNEGGCEWHYKPCGAPCTKTCRNPSGRCAYHLPGLEGCYPNCPGDRPYFSEEEMKCVSVCGCYDDMGNYHQLGKTFTTGEVCQSCKCTNEGIISCEHDTNACYCYYEGKRYNYNEVIYNTTDGLGSCITAVCGINGTINREVYKCAGITTKPPFEFTTSSRTESIPTRTTMCVHKVCRWMGWYDLNYPSYESTSGDYETPENIRAKGHNLCKNPDKVECRAKELPDETLHSLSQNVICTPTDGLICNNKDQTPPVCYNYEVRFYCCNLEPCGPLTATPATKTTGGTTSIAETKTSPPYIPESTTPLVIGTTVPTSQPSTLSSMQPISTSCPPKCQWTQWFDDHNPKTSPDGDFERFEDIRARGLVCEHPQDIECQAKDYAHTTNPAPDQNLHCNVKVGLVCNHSEQTKKPYKCVNYQVKFLCCDYSHCQPLTTSVTSKPTSAKTQYTSTTSSSSTLPHTISTTSQSTPLVSTSAEVTTGKQTTTTLPTPPSTRAVTSGIISTTPTATQSTTLMSTSAEVTTGKQTTTTLPTPLSTLVSTSTPLVSTSTGVTTGKQITTILSPPLSTLVSTSFGISTGSTLATTLSRATPCFCHVSGTPDSLFSPGEVIYNRTDSSGCHFIAICDANCEIKRYPVFCPTTTPRPSVTTSGTLPLLSSTTVTPETPRTTEIVFSTPVPDCPDVDPPRKYNETWMFNNCTKATCEGNNRIVMVPLPQAEKNNCASGLEPKKIVNKDGCIVRYECECFCKGWDHYNFMTFDGTSYTFHGNCTYILVKEIVNKYGNLRILLDNDFCDVAANQPCSRTLLIYYKSMEVRLTSEIHEGVRVNKIFFGNESVQEGFAKDGIVATSAGVTMTIEMLDIDSFVSFNGFTFFIMVPYELFQGNTEGQCGSCSNDQSDDCRKPNGQKADSCSESAIYWQVPDINKPYCQVGPTTPPIVSTTVPTTSVEATPTPCSFPSPLCQLIISDIFADCHKVLSPRKFYDNCLIETCQIFNDSLSCLYIDMYASLCTANGACADWRSKTEGKCPYLCPKDKVYAPCAPIHPRTCENELMHDQNDHVAERCVCPEGSILFSSHTGLCVPECGCVGPDGSPKPPGSKWKSNCQECTCDPLTISIHCKPQSCPLTTHDCVEEGYMPVSVLNATDPCCSIITCVCNTSMCSNEKKICEPGYHVASISYDNCCGSIKCEITENVCLVNGSVYKPEMIVPGKSCETCTCSSVTDPATKRNVVECKPVTCNTDCPMGHEYQIKPGECCGTCIQVACIIIINGTAEILEPGQTKVDNCKQYKCEPKNNMLVLVETIEMCPFFDPDCKPDQIEWTQNGCCKICKEIPNCKPYKNQTLIRENECISSETVELTYCEGTCLTSSVYSLKEKAFQHNCNCCQESKSHKKEVTLTCLNGTTIIYDYLYVDECKCSSGCNFEAPAS
ncbi:mucin-5AC-like [Notechis scutatus]|uniref:Mucin-5AC-like n=1 Tax=Notechis scutatus TaxID=8663 RepID=A0A6J1U124_9SAUR|nr:mucin-5AC-like [Notechis scutatus]